MRVCDAKKLIGEVWARLEEFKLHPENRDQLRCEIDRDLEGFSDEIVGELVRKLKTTRKKRERQKRRRCLWGALKKSAAEDRRLRELEIDRWRQGVLEKEAEKQVQENLRRQADVVLHTVRKQKAEAKRFLKLIPGLAQLRDLRCQRSTGTAVSSANSTHFRETMDRLKSLWEKQHDEYCKEEKALKAMLDSGTATKLAAANQEISETLQEWEIAIFGEKLENDSSWDNLLTTRSHWDQFLASDGSAIPPGWILPQPLGETWKNAVNYY